MQDLIASARADFLQAKIALDHALATTPDDRLNWSPSPSARTPIAQVVHAAHSIDNISKMLWGDPFTVPTTAAADAGFLEMERNVSSREKAAQLFDEKASAFVAWLDALIVERLVDEVVLPFGMGKAPVWLAITFPAKHTIWHVAQIEYIQTAYGDRDWHVPYGR